MKKYIGLLIYIVLSLSLLGVHISLKIFQDLDEQFIMDYERNTFVLQRKLSNIDDILQLNGVITNYLMNDNNLPSHFGHSKKSELLKYLQYDEKLDMFHMDTLAESDLELYDYSNISGQGNLDFLEDENNIKTKELYTSLIMNDRFKIINEMIESSQWVYYVGLDGILSIRVPEGFITTDEYRFNEELLTFDLVTKGTLEEHPDRETVYWSGPFKDELVGEESIITASYPVDYKGEYIGALSVDVIINNLTEELSDEYEVYVITDNGDIIINNAESRDNSDIKHYTEAEYKIALEDLLNLEDGKIHKIGKYEVLMYRIDGTPYTLIEVYPNKDHMIDLMYEILPMIVVIFLIIISGIYYIRGKVFKEKEAELNYVVKHDPLTGVLNRRGLHQELDVIGDENFENQFSLIVLDIDHFKQVNDTFGHKAGDEVLVTIAKMLKVYVEKNALVARFGGEEFLIVAKYTLDEMLQLSEKIRKSVENYEFSIDRQITISIGVAEHTTGDSRLALFEKADTALYLAKQKGRNRTCYYEQNSKEIIQYTVEEEK